MRMLIVGYCFGIRSERRLCEEVHLNLAYRWFRGLGLDGDGPDHSTFSKTRQLRSYRNRKFLRESSSIERHPISFMSRSISARICPSARSTPACPAAASGKR